MVCFAFFGFGCLFSIICFYDLSLSVVSLSNFLFVLVFVSEYVVSEPTILRDALAPRPGALEHASHDDYCMPNDDPFPMLLERLDGIQAI